MSASTTATIPSRLVRKDRPEVCITGTLEVLSGVANIAGGARNPDGTLELHWEGGTTIYWDEQRTQLDATGIRLYVDEDGETVNEANVILESELAP